jgi:hypothetical protein
MLSLLSHHHRIRHFTLMPPAALPTMTRTSDPHDKTAIPANGAAPIVGAAAIVAYAADSISNGAGIDGIINAILETAETAAAEGEGGGGGNRHAHVVSPMATLKTSRPQLSHKEQWQQEQFHTIVHTLDLAFAPCLCCPHRCHPCCFHRLS